VLFGFLTQWQEFVRAVLTAREARAAEHGGWGCTIDERRRRIVDS
jgi:hypothetical protein